MEGISDDETLFCPRRIAFADYCKRETCPQSLAEFSAQWCSVFLAREAERLGSARAALPLLVPARRLVYIRGPEVTMAQRSLTIALLALAAQSLAGCGNSDPPAQVAGSYTIAITNGDNPCQFQNWTAGTMTSGISLTLTQNGSDLTATVEGAAGGVVSLLLGSAKYEGHIDGTSFEVDNFGTNSFKSGNCAFTIKSTAKGTISGDVIMGTIDYSPVTNSSPACGGLGACVDQQRFNGTRPPTH
jgi:hypothetical protein